MVPILQTEKRVGPSSSNTQSNSQDHKFYENFDFFNAIDEFENNMVNTKGFKDKYIRSFDLGLDDDFEM